MLLDFHPRPDLPERPRAPDLTLTEQFIEAISGKSLPGVSLPAAVKDWLAEARATTAPTTVEKYESVTSHPEARDILAAVRLNPKKLTSEIAVRLPRP